MGRILVLDNYDSFTYNLVHIIRELGYGANLDVVRNDKITLDEVEQYEYILLSPGPGLPKTAGIMPDLIKRYGPEKNILGICLGHQAIGEVYGSSLLNLDKVYHGIVTDIILDSKDEIFHEVPQVFSACRYHSWVIDNRKLSPELIITGKDEKGEIMSIKHKSFKVRGIQYHPESVASEYGMKIIDNWLAS